MYIDVSYIPDSQIADTYPQIYNSDFVAEDAWGSLVGFQVFLRSLFPKII